MKENTKTNGFAAALDSKFEVSKRGSSVKQEVLAGIGAFLVGVSALLVNTQLIGTYYGNYAGSYFGITFVVLLATAVLGVVANVPVMATASMGMSTLVLTFLSANSGLTYANMMLITLISAVITLVIAASPLKKIFIDALPEGVRKALPAGVGLYVILKGLQNTGLVSEAGTLASISDLGTLQAFYFLLALGAILIYAVYLAVGRKNALGSTYLILIALMWACGIIFYMESFIGGQTATTVVYERLNLFFATDGAQPYNIANGISSMSFGKVLSEGTNFAAYTEGGGKAAQLMFTSILTFVTFGLYSNVGTYEAAAVCGNMENDENMEKKEKLALMIASAANIIAPLFGACPVEIGAHSSIATKDGAKTGLASCTAAVGYLIALFTWFFFAMSATTTNGVGMWINDTEVKLAAYVQDSFAFNDVIMVLAGVCMLKAFRNFDTKNIENAVPFIATVFGTAFLGNAAYGAALGLGAYVILKLIGSSRKETNLVTVALAVVLIAASVYCIKAGTNFVEVVQQPFGFGGPPGM